MGVHLFNDSGGKGQIRWKADLAPTTKANIRLNALWRSLAGEADVPLFTQLDMLELAEVLPQVTVFEFRQDEPAFLVKFTGSKSVEMYGVDSTGYMIRPSGNGEGLYYLYQVPIDLKCPVLCTSKVITADTTILKDFLQNEVLLLPFASDVNGAITHLVSHQDFA